MQSSVRVEIPHLRTRNNLSLIDKVSLKAETHLYPPDSVAHRENSVFHSASIFGLILSHFTENCEHKFALFFGGKMFSLRVDVVKI